MIGTALGMEAKRSRSEFMWHLVQFKPNCAMIAKRNLARQGFEVFLPLKTQTRIAQSNFIEEIKPLFPGYLFVGATNESGPIHSIRSTYGVSHLVRFGTKAASVPPQLIDELKYRFNTEEVIGRNEAFEKGEKVRLTHGPFTNLVGEVERTAPDHRVWLLLDVMNQRTRVSVAQSMLQAI